MEKNITLTVRSKNIVGQCPLHWSSNTVDYITATFDLDEEWSACDVVKAVWSGREAKIVTLLDASNKCVVPHEVLATVGKVRINLTGVVYGEGEEFTRITTAPVTAIIIDATAKVDGDETAPLTPSQFEQFVETVISETEKVTGMTATAETLPAGEDATASYSDGVLSLGIPRGDKGDTGERGEQGIPGERGETGAAGNGIESVTKTGTSGLVDTYTVLFTDGTSTTFTVTNGAKGDTGDTGNGIASAVLNADYTLTLNFTDGTSYTTPTPIRGAKGETGETGAAGADGFSPTATVTKEGDTATITITDKNGTTTAAVMDGSDADVRWGNISGTLSDQTDLQSALNQKVDKVAGKGLSTEDFTSAEKTKLAGIEAGAQVNTITGVKGDAEQAYRTGNVNITKENIGLGNVDNTSDLDKPVSTATQAALNLKQDKLQWDTVPTQESTKPVTSGGLFDVLNPVATEATAQDLLDVETDLSTSVMTLLNRLIGGFPTSETGDLIVQDLMEGNILLAQLAVNIKESEVF